MQTDEDMLVIPHRELSGEALCGLIEEFVTRDGTDNGDETPLQTRVERVRQALSRGTAVIVFDADHQIIHDLGFLRGVAYADHRLVEHSGELLDVFLGPGA